ncbi:hypothetical protein HD597_000177 [Nonomuraea thailandensis]|uniref:Uncharacterized protein n=1 Tax=Nonomuraea thailandensis TaxID=1188745 RepID=A0A9X2G8T9_9ACTN|nr:hypothetical protein [Nonomuraea thailandensis]MCP2353157.1 hypothetical protein [Nonomuraea thailandensis]
MRLGEFSELAVSCRERLRVGFQGFRTDDKVSSLSWPPDVVEQFLYDHADHDRFLRDYGEVDLSAVTWDVEIIAVEDFLEMPTGPSGEGCIEEYAEDPDWWVKARNAGVHIGVQQCWQAHGTWKRWPILIDRALLTPAGSGLQVIEGRTRVGVLRVFIVKESSWQHGTWPGSGVPRREPVLRAV